MKITPNSRRCHHVAIVGIFLVVASLVVGMISCGGSCVTLTITSTAGGSVTTPGEGNFTYCALQCCPGTDLVAEAEEGYRFVEWTGDRDLPDNVDAAITRIQLGHDCSITAHF